MVMWVESALFFNLYYLGAGVLFAFAFYWLFKSNHSGLHLPPGPKGLPILGSLPFFDMKNLHIRLQKMAEKYGSVFGLHIGGRYVIVVEDFNIVKELCTKDDFVDRPPDYFRITPTHKNIIEMSGTEWKDHRMFQVNTLKVLGLTKPTTYSFALEEIEKVISTLKQGAQEPWVDLDKILADPIDSIMYFILYGKPFEPDHPYMIRFPKVVEALSMMFRWREDSVFKPWLNYLLPIMHPGKLKAYKKDIYFATSTLRKEIDDHRESLDPNDPKDFIDYYLLEMKKRRDSVADGYTDSSLIGNVLILLNAGSITTRLTLIWYLMTLADKQEVQERCYNEIMDHLGPDRNPEDGDQCHLPYLCASIAENQRMTPISYLNLLRQCNKDGAKISGFDVPKGTVLLQNLWSINYNKDLWKDPENYRPERYLSLDQRKFKLTDHLTPFSYGKRQCPGMRFARTELFIFAVCLIRRFKFLPPEGGIITDSVFLFNPTPTKPFVRVEVRKAATK